MRIEAGAIMCIRSGVDTYVSTPGMLRFRMNDTEVSDNIGTITLRIETN
jgi:hypothetical protein